MNWIEINGIRSTFIDGLMINQLPPITKPGKRVEVTEVDGLDGDIIQELGYEAYDKEFNISILPNGDVNEIIEYLNSEGKIMFSNEQGKYYKFKTVGRIDFERLIRYKTATVVIHCQPYKYSDEAARECDITNETSISVFNEGNVTARPKITIVGSGTITLSLNGNIVFTIDLTDATGIVIDAAELEAYAVGDSTTLLNRLVTGSYSAFTLPKGSNTISWTGTITKITTENTSRWV